MPGAVQNAKIRIWRGVLMAEGCPNSGQKFGVATF
jgi:hypothetical protein